MNIVKKKWLRNDEDCLQFKLLSLSICTTYRINICKVVYSMMIVARVFFLFITLIIMSIFFLYSLSLSLSVYVSMFSTILYPSLTLSSVLFMAIYIIINILSVGLLRSTFMCFIKRARLLKTKNKKMLNSVVEPLFFRK